MTKPNDRLLLKTNLKQLRLPTIGAEFEKLAREATASNQTFEQYLLRLTELEVATRQSNALTSRIRQADFPVEKDLETFDFSVPSTVNKQKVLELASFCRRNRKVHPSGQSAKRCRRHSRRPERTTEQ